VILLYALGSNPRVALRHVGHPLAYQLGLSICPPDSSRTMIGGPFSACGNPKGEECVEIPPPSRPLYIPFRPEIFPTSYRLSFFFFAYVAWCDTTRHDTTRHYLRIFFLFPFHSLFLLFLKYKNSGGNRNGRASERASRQVSCVYGTVTNSVVQPGHEGLGFPLKGKGGGGGGGGTPGSNLRFMPLPSISKR
jgi:hypothetical protein